MKIIINNISRIIVNASPLSLMLGIATIAFSIISFFFILFILLFSLSELFILFCHYFYQLLFVPMLLNLAVAIIFVSNPIYSLLILICIFLYSAFLLLSLHIQFLAMVYIIIYIGAIAILFLFVLMMFNLKQLSYTYSLYLRDIDLYIFVGAVLLFYLKIKTEFMIFNNVDEYMNNIACYKNFNVRYYVNFIYSDILIFGNLLYTYHSFIFIFSGLLLFIAMIGSLVLALSITENTLTSQENATIIYEPIYWIEIILGLNNPIEWKDWKNWPRFELLVFTLFLSLYAWVKSGHPPTVKPKLYEYAKEVGEAPKLISYHPIKNERN